MEYISFLKCNAEDPFWKDILDTPYQMLQDKMDILDQDSAHIQQKIKNSFIENQDQYLRIQQIFDQYQENLELINQLNSTTLHLQKLHVQPFNKKQTFNQILELPKLIFQSLKNKNFQDFARCFFLLQKTGSLFEELLKKYFSSLLYILFIQFENEDFKSKQAFLSQIKDQNLYQTIKQQTFDIILTRKIQKMFEKETLNIYNQDYLSKVIIVLNKSYIQTLEEIKNFDFEIEVNLEKLKKITKSFIKHVFQKDDQVIQIVLLYKNLVQAQKGSFVQWVKRMLIKQQKQIVEKFIKQIFQFLKKQSFYLNHKFDEKQQQQLQEIFNKNFERLSFILQQFENKPKIIFQQIQQIITKIKLFIQDIVQEKYQENIITIFTQIESQVAI